TPIEGAGSGCANDSVRAARPASGAMASLRGPPAPPRTPSSLSARRSNPRPSHAVTLGIPSMTSRGAARLGLQPESAVAVRKIERTQTDFKGAERRPVILAIPPLWAPPLRHAIACIFVGMMTGWRRPYGATAARVASIDGMVRAAVRGA